MIARPHGRSVTAALCALTALLFANVAIAAPALVQTNSSANGANATTITATFASTPAAGNLLVAIAGNHDATTVQSIPAGWQTAVQDTGIAPGQLVIYKVAGAAEPTAVTITYTTASRLGIHIYEYSGIPLAVFRQVVETSGSGSSLAAGAVTTTTNNELVIAGFTINANTSFTAWSNSFVEENDFANTGPAASRSTYGGADRVAPTPGSYSTTATAAASGAWLGQIVRFSPASISGTVFEDANYGGGAGRSLAASSGSRRSGARVEIYNSSGNFVTFAATDASGNYSFSGLAAGNYTVRVVSGSVSSSRGAAPGPPVQTFRTNGLTGTVGTADPNRVGGENPVLVDAGNGSTTLAALTTASTTAQSITTVTLGAADITGIDFGFNFDTIVNTNDTGQGSLRQFIANASALANAGLAQVGQTAGKEVSIFMISNGAVHAGLRAGLANQLTAGVARIVPATALPAITGADTTLDGSTQTANVGDTNSALLGTGGTVGVDALVLGQVTGPEVEIRDVGSLADGIQIQADNVRVRGLAILGFGAADGDAGILIANTFTGALIENNVLGSAATSFTDPGAGLHNWAGIYSAGAGSSTIQNNLIGFSAKTGIYVASASANWTVSGNEIRDAGTETTDGDGITVNASSNNTFTGNLVTGASSQGIVVTAAVSNGNTFTNNTVTGNGVGTASGGVAQSAGITLRPTAGATTFNRNVIQANYGAGLAVNSAATGILLTRNSFLANGTIAARNGSAATGQIGIDLNAAADNIDLGTAPFVTLNDNGDVDSGGNGLLNTPILSTAQIVGTNLVLTGFARPGSVIELYVAAADPTGFGEGQTWKLTVTEGGTGAGGNDPYSDTDVTTGTYGPGAINGL